MTTRRPLVLVGASGLAREVLAVTREHGPHTVVGVLDDDPARHGTLLAGVPVLGGPAALATWPDADVLVTVGPSAPRAAVVDRLRELVAPERWASVVHPASAVPRGCSVGPGSVLLAGVVLTADVRVGAHVVLMPRVTLTHDDRVEDLATLAAGVSLGGGVVVAERAYVGMNASVRPGVRVGVASTLGMGAALLTDLPDGETWAGVPARPLPVRAPGAAPVPAPAADAGARVHPHGGPSDARTTRSDHERTVRR